MILLLYMYIHTYRLRAVEINGIQYKKDSLIILGLEEDTVQFGKIIEIALTPIHRFLFVVSCLNTICYSHHYHAYEVCPTDQLHVCSYEDLHDYHPLQLNVAYGSGHRYMVSLKYHVF